MEGEDRKNRRRTSDPNSAICGCIGSCVQGIHFLRSKLRPHFLHIHNMHIKATIYSQGHKHKRRAMTSENRSSALACSMLQCSENVLWRHI